MAAAEVQHPTENRDPTKLQNSLGPSTWLHEWCHPRESVLIGAIALLCFSFLLIFFCGSLTGQLDDLRHWSQLPWERVECRVRKAGITYTGDCSNQSSETFKFMNPPPVYNFSACAAPTGPPRGCAAAVARAFVKGRRLAAAGWAIPPSVFNIFATQRAPVRRLRPVHGKGNQFGTVCQDRYALWALVQVDGSDANICSYRTGLFGHSQDYKWEHVLVGRGELDSGEPRQCWQLTLQSVGLLQLHSCNVVALEDPSIWEEASEGWVQRHRNIHILLMGIGVILAMVGIGAFVLHQRCWKAGVERWIDLEKPGIWSSMFHIEGPCEGSESTRARLVRERWGQFRANIVADYQPRTWLASEYARVPATDPGGPGSPEIPRHPRGGSPAPAQ